MFATAACAKCILPRYSTLPRVSRGCLRLRLQLWSKSAFLFTLGKLVRNCSRDPASHQPSTTPETSAVHQAGKAEVISLRLGVQHSMCIKPCKEKTKNCCGMWGPARLFSAGWNILHYFPVNIIRKLLCIIFMPQNIYCTVEFLINHVAAS